MNIYAKLTLLCVFLVVFTSAVLFFFTNRQIQNTFRDELISNIARQSEETITNIDQFIFSRINDLRLAARNPYFRISDLSQDELIKRLQELESLNPLYHSFSFFNNDRVRIGDSKREALNQQHSLNNYWTKLGPENKEVMDVSVSESMQRPVLHFASVVDDLFENKPIGVLVGQIPVNELYKILGDISQGFDTLRNLRVTLASQDGTILYTNVEEKRPLEDKFDFSILNTSNRLNEHTSILETEDELHFFADEPGYANYAGNKWRLIVTVSKEDAFSPLYEIQQQLFGLILSVLAVSIVLALVVANYFVKPIIKLSQAAEEMSKGNLGVAINIRSNDEIGKLARLLSVASEQLQKKLNEEKALNERLEEQRAKMEAQKTQLESANKQVSDSIIYAERIQKSILPELTVISKLVKDAFVIYRPKDVVSGDFYWFERVRQGRNEFLIIACADCTGHGVPGAIMSIMGSNQLTNIVYYQNYTDPNKILARMDKVIKFELQRDNLNQNRDGLEIGVCVINLDDLTMEFSGAGIPLNIIKKGTTEMITYKSPKYMIGGIEGDEKEVGLKLNKEQIQLEPGDKLYLFSDGFQDQFGGADDKKFLSKNLKVLIEETSQQPMESQKKLIEKAFDDWKRNSPQTDDVVVLGVEI